LDALYSWTIVGSEGVAQNSRPSKFITQPHSVRCLVIRQDPVMNSFRTKVSHSPFALQTTGEELRLWPGRCLLKALCFKCTSEGLEYPKSKFATIWTKIIEHERKYATQKYRFIFGW
jgi:hypothetical protein